jgi:hypothetical protein
MHVCKLGEQRAGGGRVAFAERVCHAQQRIVSGPEVRTDPQHAEQRLTHLREHSSGIARRHDVGPDFEEAIARGPVCGQASAPAGRDGPGGMHPITEVVWPHLDRLSAALTGEYGGAEDGLPVAFNMRLHPMN